MCYISVDNAVLQSCMELSLFWLYKLVDQVNLQMVHKSQMHKKVLPI